MRINIIDMLSSIDSTIKWTSRISSYNKKHSLFIESDGKYLGTIENLILYVETSKLKREHKDRLLSELYKTQNSQLKKELAKRPTQLRKTDISEVLEAFDVIDEKTTINTFLCLLDSKKDDDISGIFSILHKYYFYVLPYVTYSSMKLRFTKFRNAVRDRNYSQEKEDIILRFFKLPENVLETIENTYRKKIDSKNKNLSSLITVSIKQAKKLMEELESDIFSKKFDNLTRQQKIAKLYLYLHLGTGRRPIEIYKYGAFTATENNSLIFSGQAKTRKKDTPPYTIPCLFCENNKIVTALQLFRKIAGRLTQDKNGQHTITTWLIVGGWNELLQKINISPKSIIFYDLRSLYSLLSDNVLNDNMESRTYIAHILGHKFEDTAKSYTKFKIIK
jgi:hypothetical protein